MFIVTMALDGLDALNGVRTATLLKLGANNLLFLKAGEVWRLITYMFLHGNAMHLLVNMISLYILGIQMETFIGRYKFLIIYLVSGICGGLLSAALSKGLVVSVGASGAIFGLAGAMVYFGLQYRTYLGTALKQRVLPVIIANLAIGFLSSGIDNACHIGGLLGGFLITMVVGINGKSKKSERINGIICLLIYLAVLSYLIFFR